MTNIYAEIYVPALDLSMDALISVHITVNQAVSLISEMVMKKEQILLDPEDLALFDGERNVMLRGEDSFDDLPVGDACYLVVI